MPSACPIFFKECRMQIISERPTDASAIRAVTVAAFKDAPYSTQTEAGIVDALRSAGALTLSLVALQDDEIVGHVAFSPVTIGMADGDWYGLGPVSVRPDRQRQGIGQAMIRDGLNRLMAMASSGCVVFGDPAYYRRFGFESDPALFYRGEPPGYFQRRVFTGPAPSGEVRYHSGFEA
jgi:putative acetyltransferase